MTFTMKLIRLLEQLTPEVINHYWFRKKSIQGKFFTVNNRAIILKRKLIQIYIQ
jgi:hypothetical protein